MDEIQLKLFIEATRKTTVTKSQMVEILSSSEMKTAIKKADKEFRIWFHVNKHEMSLPRRRFLELHLTDRPLRLLEKLEKAIMSFFLQSNTQLFR